MKMRKILAFALVLVFLFAMTACGKTNTTTEETPAASNEPAQETEQTTDTQTPAEEPAAEPVDLVVAWWGSQSRNEKFQAALDLYASENENVTIETQTNGFSDHLTALSAAAASGDMPDMAMLQSAYYQSFVDSDLLVDLTPYVESGALDLSNVSENILAATTIDGKLYGVCAGMNSPSLIYNKTLLDENGITIEDNMSTEQFAEKCAEIYEKTGYRTFISNAYQMIEMICRGNDQILYKEDSLGVDSYEDLLPYFELLERGRSEGWLIDYSLTIGLSNSEEQPIVYGTTPETSSWCSFFNSNQAAAMQAAAPEGMELALTTCPLDNPTKSNYLREAMSWTISTQSKNIDAAVALLNYMINSVDANALIQAEPGVPASSVVADSIAADLPDIQKTIFAYINNVITPNCSASNPPAGAGGSEVTNLIYTLEENVYYGEMTAQEAAQQLFEEGNRIMAESAAQ